MISITTSNTAAAKAKVDALVVGIHSAARRPDGSAARRPDASAAVILTDEARAVDKALGGRLAATVAALGGSGAAGEVTKIATLGELRADVVVAAGLGPPQEETGSRTSDAGHLEALRRAAGAAVRTLAGTSTVGLALPAASPDEAQAVAEGALLGAYTFHRYRFASQEDHKPGVAHLVVLTPAARDRAVKARVDEALTVIAAVYSLATSSTCPPPTCTRWNSPRSPRAC